MNAALEALLLDFDGLLYDTETAAYASWQAVYARFGQDLALDFYVRERIGRPPNVGLDLGEELARRTDGAIGRDAAWAARNELRPGLLPHHLIDGAQELLVRARERGLKIAVVTSNHRDNVAGHLARAGCTFAFDAIVSADGDPSRGKPAPTLYLEALERLAVPAARALALEDSPAGVAAAKAAGLTCYAVPNDITRGQPGLGTADRILGSLREMTT